MKLARVIGNVTLAKHHPAMRGASLRLVEIVDDITRRDANPLGGDSVVAWDICSSTEGDLVALAEGPESAAPFRPEIKPIDASIVALIDHCEVQPSTKEP
ncbi:MAG: EutN/CcmL family microcompartment protein [Planctomycetota bacterium]